MKKRVLITALFALAAFTGFAQYPFVSITQIQNVSQTDLMNCVDSSAYFGDTVKTVGIVVTDGGLSEVASGSVIGGHRPFIFLVDTATGGIASPFAGIEMQGIIPDGNGGFQVYNIVQNLLAGDIIEVTGYVNAFNNGTQINTLDANSVSIIGFQAPPTPTIVNLSDLNDQNRVNKLPTGEQWENSFVELQNVTVSTVIPFSNGRVSFNVVDAQGNTMNVSDRFLAGKTSSHQVVNGASPSTTGTGSFVPPVPGTFYNSLKGVIRHDGNGCLTNSGTRGYELNPFDSSHYDVSFAPPFIDEVERDPLVPSPTQDVTISCTITDFDGSVDSVGIAWSTDPNLAPSAFAKFPMTLAIGSTDEYEYDIPQQALGTRVRYYIYAEDNDNNPSFFPSKPTTQLEPNFEFYTVRSNGELTINDIQFSLASNNASPFQGNTVTVKGVVTASQKAYDLGYVYIQDTAGTEYSGVSLIGSQDLAGLFRNEWVEITGQVQENFGFTQISVASVVRLGDTDTIQPIAIDPSDSAAYASGEWEKYEGMLVKYENPTPGGKLYITDANYNNAEYLIGTDPSFSLSRSARAQAGRQSGTSANSSLYVQLVTDTFYQNNQGIMNLPAVVTSDTMTMDAMIGVINYGFSNYRILPRANDDIIGLNAPLDMNVNRPNNVSIEEIQNFAELTVYPNPAHDFIHISIEARKGETFHVNIYDLNGRLIKTSAVENGRGKLSISELKQGVYLMKVYDRAGISIGTNQVIKN